MRRVNFVGKLWYGLLIAALLLAFGCSSEPQTVEVTRLVTQDVPVTVEVVQEVAVEVTVEVPVEVTVEVPQEVTRVVEVMVTPTPAPTEAAAEPTAAPEATAVPVDNTYTVQAGDTLAFIAFQTGVAVSDIRAANGLGNSSFVRSGQELVIPGWDGTLLANAVANAAATAVPGAPPASATGQNLLPNPSFEDDWYFFNGINELQLPVGWFAFTDEGPNTLSDDPNDLFLRPEIRVITRSDLPAGESNQFVFNGNKTIKAFKGGGPTSFGIFTDVALPAGSYRFTVRYFPDTVLLYNGSEKVWNTDPQAAEVRIIYNEGGTAWSGTTVATRNTMTYDFKLNAPATVRLGAAFRNRFVNHNNSWFIDEWSLVKLGN